MYLYTRAGSGKAPLKRPTILSNDNISDKLADFTNVPHFEQFYLHTNGPRENWHYILTFFTSCHILRKDPILYNKDPNSDCFWRIRISRIFCFVIYPASKSHCSFRRVRFSRPVAANLKLVRSAFSRSPLRSPLKSLSWSLPHSLSQSVSQSAFKHVHFVVGATNLSPGCDFFCFLHRRPTPPPPLFSLSDAHASSDDCRARRPLRS